MNELEDGKKINTRQYSLNSECRRRATKSRSARASRSRRDTNSFSTWTWARVSGADRGAPGWQQRLPVRADISNFAIPEQGTGHESRPVVRQFKINASTLALPGKPMVVGSVDDPNSKRQFQLEVTVTKLTIGWEWRRSGS